MSMSLTQKMKDLREEIRSLEEELINDNKERSKIMAALEASDTQIDVKRRLRLAAIAALTELEQGKI